ncbi:hypothetical protein PanWU01x14_310130 [Parasponia andersonii]|uniref:Uncharacterized protein n=1 Tax=Parasponia andersonii TaxID=3476 RepID=A0A2P5AQC4_PARAD|nr:hypothetical protein PanWU01x14_310130 [Parasponia andersonii]
MGFQLQHGIDNNTLGPPELFAVTREGREPASLVERKRRQSLGRDWVGVTRYVGLGVRFLELSAAEFAAAVEVERKAEEAGAGGEEQVRGNPEFGGDVVHGGAEHIDDQP